jgi:hydroxypyruvate isomerase
MLKQRIEGIGHIQIAGVPDRNEPDTGELNCGYLLELIDSLGYTGWVGCEYRPKGKTSDGLGWVRKYQPSV